MNSTPTGLPEYDQEMIALGASLASGCQPCTAFHFRAARLSGADDEQLSRAAGIALEVRRRATDIMDEMAGHTMCEGLTAYTSGADPHSLLDELVASAAACAVNSVGELKAHLAAARQQGATDDQVLKTLKVACAVKDVAGKKARDAAAQFLGASETEAEACDCGELTGASREAGLARAGRAEAFTTNQPGGCSCHE